MYAKRAQLSAAVVRMMIAEFLSKHDGVKQRGMRWWCLCRAHSDKNPSLSVIEGERGLLVKCWAGCSLQAVCAALGIHPRELFFDALDPDPSRRRAAALERDRRRRVRALQAEREGAVIDALKAADVFVESRRGVDISRWTDERLDSELQALADAYQLRESETWNG